MRIRDAIPAWVLLALESLLLFRFTGSPGSVIWPAAAVLMTCLPVRGSRLVLAGVFLAGCLAVVFGLGSFAGSVKGPGVQILLAQVLQVAVLVRRASGSAGAAGGMIFSAAGVACAYVAYSHAIRPLPQLFAECMGTLILAVSFLQHDGWLGGRGARLEPSAQGRALKYLVLLALIAVALIVSSTGAYPLRQVADKAWLLVERRGLGNAAAVAVRPGVAGAVEEDDDSDMTLEMGAGAQGRPKAHEPALHLIIHNESAGRLLTRQRMYFALSAFDTYETSRWVTSVPRSVVVDEEDGCADGTVAVTNPVVNAVRYTVFIPRPRAQALPGLPRIAAVAQAAVERNINGSFFSPVSLKGVEKVTYSMESSDLRWDDLDQADRVGGQADAIFARLPTGEFSDRVRSLAFRITQGRHELGPAVDGIVAYLQSECRYSGRGAGGGSGVPLDDFLFGSRTGDCRLFAGGFVLLLRAAGFPARTCAGYSGGEYDPERKMLTFFRDEGHAWAEVFVAGQGWVLVDPTPAVPAAPVGPRIVRFGGHFNFDDARSVAELVREKFSGKLTLGKGTGAGWFGMLLAGVSPTLWLGLAMIVAAAVMVASHRRAALAGGRAGCDPAGGGVRPYFRLFCGHFARVGCAIRKGQTASEYLVELKRRNLVKDQYDGLIDYFNGTSYGKMPLSPGSEKAFRAAVRRDGLKRSGV